MSLRDLMVGDEVDRQIGGAVSMVLKVTAVTDDTIVCGAWEFCRNTGAEIDEELGWGPKFGVTGSVIKEPV